MATARYGRERPTTGGAVHRLGPVRRRSRVARGTAAAAVLVSLGAVGLSPGMAAASPAPPVSPAAVTAATEIAAAHASVVATSGASAVGPTGQSHPAVLPRPHSAPSCTFNGVTTVVPDVTPGSLVTIACTGWVPGETVAAGEISPLFLTSGSAADADPNGQSFLADGAGDLNATFVVPNPFTASDPAAVCPPTADQVAQGYLRCGLVLVDATSNAALVALQYASSSAPVPPVGSSAVGMAATPDGGGYWLGWADGDVTVHGDAQSYGNASQLQLNQPITHIVSTPDGKGYWLVAADGGTFSFGDAGFFGSMGAGHLNAPVVDMAPTADGGGYWLVGSDGGIFAFGDAQFYGSTGSLVLNKPVVGIAADGVTGGYWLVASDGGIFSFNAPFFGSMGGIPLNKPINGMAATSGDGGYWLVASDGGIFAGGNAPFRGSTGAMTLNQPIVGMAADPASDGYWLVASDGGVFSFDAPFYGAF